MCTHTTNLWARHSWKANKNKVLEDRVHLDVTGKCLHGSYRMTRTHCALRGFRREWLQVRVPSNYLVGWHHGNLLNLPRKGCPTTLKSHHTKSDTECPFWGHNEKVTSWAIHKNRNSGKATFITRIYLKL